jgi:ligand-binding SRPBCC domain-containing protein
VIVNVCPAATSKAPPERFWRVLTQSERLGEWTDARFVTAEPPGLAQPGQKVRLTARSLGRSWPVRIDVGDMDPNRRWIDFVAYLPFGIVNREHLTLTETPEGGTLVRFN